MARAKTGEWRFYFLSLLFHSLVLGAAAFVGQASTTAFGLRGSSKVVVDVIPMAGEGIATDIGARNPAKPPVVQEQEVSLESPPKVSQPKVVERPVKKVTALPQTLPSKKVVPENKANAEPQKVVEENIESKVVVAEDLKDNDALSNESLESEAGKTSKVGGQEIQNNETNGSEVEPASLVANEESVTASDEKSQEGGPAEDLKSENENLEKNDLKVIAPFFGKNESVKSKPTYVANPVQTEAGLGRVGARGGQAGYLGSGQAGMLGGIRDSSVLVELRSVKPQYDLRDRLNRREGIVVFQYNVRANGQVDNIRMVKSSGHRALDLKSYKAFKQTLYHPGQAGEARISYRWSLVGGVEEMPSLLRRGL